MKEKRKCGNCGRRFDDGNDAMCYCKKLGHRVYKESMPCADWTDIVVF